MSFPQAKAVDSLYAEVAEYDLVLVPDAPLASALNRRLTQPQLGPFAITPRRLAAGRREESEDRLAFLELVEHTALDWKRVAYAVGNILQCWEHQADLDAILDYDAYVDDVTREAVEYVRGLETTSNELSAHQIPEDSAVAVVAEDQFTPLEQSILPTEYDTFQLFTGREFELPPFHIYESASEITEVVLDTITEDDASDVAVVLDSGSEYSTLLEAGLEDDEIPFYGGPGFIDAPHHRAFLQLLRTGHRGRNTRVKDVRALLTRLGIDVEIEHDEKRLVDLDHSAVAWLQEFHATVTGQSFDEALSAYEEQANTTLDSFREELEALGIHGDPVAEAAVDELAFYFESYEVPVDRENEGVLLADATSAAYVDRPLVFFLGLDESWTHSPPRRPWVDGDAQYARNLGDFKSLLQSGSTQCYLVQDSRGGNPVTPCLYFEDLLEREYERFSDLPHQTHNPHEQSRNARESTGFERESVGVESSGVSGVSQSTLRTYVNCPRDYFFGRLLDSPDRDYLREGNLFHDFAEFYAIHPGVVRDEPIEDLVDFMHEEVRPFIRDTDAELRRTDYRVGLETITAFLDEQRPFDDGFLPSASGWGENVFESYFDREVDSGITERWFENDALQVRGMIDLVASPTQLVDHKSGSKSAPRQVVRRSQLDPVHDTPNYQALLYLAHWRTQHPGEELAFSFFHFLETKADHVTDESSLEDSLSTVTYHPTSFEEYAASREVFEHLREEGAGNCRKTLSKTEYEDYRAVFESSDLPATRDSDELIDSDFGETLVSRMRGCVGEYKYVSSGCRQAMRELARIRGRNYFEEDLDAFEEFVRDRIRELNQRRRGEDRFPVEGLAGEPNYRYVDHRDLLVAGDHA